MRKRLLSGVGWLFHGTVDTRVRASWRILAAFALTFAGAVAGSLVVQGVGLPDLVAPLAVHLCAVVAVAVTVVVLARYLDRRNISEYGFDHLRTWWVEAVLGTALGVGLVGLAFALSYRRGTVTVTDTLSTGSAGSLATGFGIVVLGWIFVGIWEETLFRGIFLKNAAEGLATRGLSPQVAVLGGLVSSSLVYGFLHGPLGSNPDSVSLVYALVMTSVMGGLFGLAYLLSDRLALPIGLHTGINAAEHNLFFGPPDGVTPAVMRANYAAGGHVQFQSIDPMVIVPVFLVGYALVVGWCYLQDGTVAVGTQARRNTLSSRE